MICVEISWRMFDFDGKIPGLSAVTDRSSGPEVVEDLMQFRAIALASMQEERMQMSRIMNQGM